MAKIKSKIAEPGERVAINDVKEVQEVLDIKAEYDSLKGEFPEVFLRLTDIMDRYNTAVEVAEKIVRAREITCGPFVNFSATVKYDAEKLFDEIGEKAFFEVGGSVENPTVYKIDKDKLEAAIQANKIHEESLKEFRTVERKYRKPSKMELP